MHKRFRKIFWPFLIILLILQVFIAPEIANIVAALFVVGVSALTYFVLFRKVFFERYPVASLIVFGQNFSTLSGALFLQTLGWKPLVYNLGTPIWTFAMGAILNLCLLFSLLMVYKGIYFKFLKVATRAILNKTYAFYVPGRSESWMLGSIGLAVLVWLASVKYSEGIEYGDVLSKTLSGFSFLAFIPFLRPIFNSIKGVATTRRDILYLAAYTAVLLFLGVASNSRGLFVVGLTNLLFSFLVYTCAGYIKITRRIKRGIILGGLLGLFAMPLLSDLATAMVLARSERTELSTSMLVSRTVSYFFDKEAIAGHRRALELGIGADQYNEVYIDNPFFSRLVSTKFLDNSLGYVERTNVELIWEGTRDKILALLPDPVVRRIVPGFDKAEVEYSIGDLLYYSQSNVGLGGYRVGSAVAHGLALFGILLFVPISILSSLLVMSIFTAFSKIDGFGRLLISPIIMLNFSLVYFLYAGDGYFDWVNWIFRALPQSIIIYSACVFFVRTIFSSRKRRASRILNSSPSGVFRA